MLGVGDYLWRLIPANPILRRVVEAAGKRRRDLFVRCGYLGLLVLMVIVALNFSGSGSSLSDMAKTAGSIFQKMSYLQLGLVALLAPIFTAGAITQEKDSQTYDILLSTPLTNGQIVLGSLLSRLFFVLALLISGIPIFSITQLFGGVAIQSIVLSFAIAAATTFVMGALAMAIATFKVGTRRTIFSFYLFVVIYMVGGILLDQLDFFHVTLGATGKLSKTSWFTPLNPFLALRTIFNDPLYIAPDLGELPDSIKHWPLGWMFSRPASFYVALMFTLSFVLIFPSIVLLRRLAQATGTLRGWVLEKLKISKGERTRKPRAVWSNPIAWREAKTKASAARASILRYGFIIAGTVGALVLVIMFSTTQPVTQYVAANSYDSTNRTLVVYSGDRAQMYSVAPGSQVTINSNASSLDQIRGRMAVKNVTSSGANRLASIDLMNIPRKLNAPDVRNFLLGAVVIEFAVILLIVTNAAASTVTREKEDGSLDMLLTTPITSRYYIWGKLRGLVSYVLPLVAVPVASVAMFVIYDLMRAAGGNDGIFQWIVLPEAILIMPGMLIMVAAFASILGMQMSLRCRTTVRAVMSSVGIVIGACGALGWCGFSALSSRGAEPAVIVSSFSPFTVLTMLINPYDYGGRMFSTDDGAGTARVLLFVFAWAATGAYALLVWTMYKSMVKNFDMTIRRQSR